MTKLLILSSDTGEGHNSAASAIQAAATLAGITASIRKPLEESGSLNRSLGDLYNFLLTRKPQWMTRYLWLIDQLRPNERDAAYRWVRGFIANFIASEEPDLILSVHPMLNHFIPRYLREAHLDIPFNTFLTDPFPPFWSGWASPLVDRYLVARTEARDALVTLGIEPRKIECVAMPVRRQFEPLEPADKLKFRQELGLSDAGVILINGGARGGGPILRIYETVRRAAGASNIVVVCGRNSGLRRRIAAAGHTNTRAVGFVSDIHRYVASADLVLTKPGALTTYETLACGVPVVLLGILALMPQESGMFEAAKRYGFGYSVDTFAQLENVIRLGPREWNLKREAVRHFYRPNNGEDIVERIQPAHARV